MSDTLRSLCSPVVEVVRSKAGSVETRWGAKESKKKKRKLVACRCAV